MPLGSSRSSNPKPIDAKARLRVADKKGRHFTLLYFLVGAAGLYFCYWLYTGVFLPDARAKLHRAETEAYAAQLASVVSRLTEWSTGETFAQVQAELEALEARGDADRAARQTLWANFESARSQRAKRMKAFADLMAEIHALPRLFDRDAFFSLEDRIAQAKYKFEKELADQLEAAWGEKKVAVAPWLDSKGGLVVHSEPSGVELLLNGRPVGKTPLGARGLAPGRMRVELRHPKYRKFERIVEIRRLETLLLDDIVLDPKTGEIELRIEGASRDDKIEVVLVCPREDGDYYYYARTFYGPLIYDPQSIIGVYQATVFVNGTLRGQFEFEVLEGKKATNTFRL